MAVPPQGDLQWQALANFISAKLAEKGWSDSRLAKESGVGGATVSRLLKARPQQIQLQTFVALAGALEVELWRLLEVAGYPIEQPSPPAETDLRFAQQLARQLDSFPELRPIVRLLFDLDEADRRAVTAFLNALATLRDEDRQ